MKHSLSLAVLGAVSSLAAPTQHKRAGNFQLFGINESGGEFDVPKWPTTQTIDTLLGDGFNTFRVLFTMEHMTPNSLDSIDNAYLGAPAAGSQTGAPGALYELVQHITSRQGHAILAPWNFGRYRQQLLDADGMQRFWTAVAAPFAGMTNVIFDTNNEYHDMPQQLVFDLNQAAIRGIRAANATAQMIMVEGNGYTKANQWVARNDNLKDLQDPSNNLVYEMHQYLDPQENASGPECIRGTDALTAATAWLNDHHQRGFLGEFAAGNTDACKRVVDDMLTYLAGEKAWLGALWWGGGQTDDAQHFFAFNPPHSQAYDFWRPTLQQHQ